MPSEKIVDRKSDFWDVIIAQIRDRINNMKSLRNAEDEILTLLRILEKSKLPNIEIMKKVIKSLTVLYNDTQLNLCGNVGFFAKFKHIIDSLQSECEQYIRGSSPHQSKGG